MPIELGDGASIRVAPPELPTVTLAPPLSTTVTVLPVAGPTGAQGLPGTPGGTGFPYVQSVPAATWIIDHNLGRKVHVSIFDLTDTVVFADVHHGTPNQTTIEFVDPVAGSAIVS